MSRKVLALDIRHHGVSAVIIKSSLRDNRISGFAYAPFSDDDAAGGNLAGALETISESLEFGGCDCVASLPANYFSFRNLQIPFRSRKKIQMVLPFEIEPSLPYAVDEVVLDFSPVRHDATKDSTDVLAAVLPKSDLDRLLETLAAFDLDPEAITIGGLPLALHHLRHVTLHEGLRALDDLRHHLTGGGAGRLQCIEIVRDGMRILQRGMRLPTEAPIEVFSNDSRLLHLAEFEED